MLMTFPEAVQHLQAGEIIAVPTEAVYGLSCIPEYLDAVQKLLALKQRDWRKGLIMVAADIEQLAPWVDWLALSPEQYQTVVSRWPGAVTWLVPAKSGVSPWITGDSHKIAVRVTDHPPLKTLCQMCGHALISTSANLSGHPPTRTLAEVKHQLGAHFPILQGSLGSLDNPTHIYDALTGKQYR